MMERFFLRMMNDCPTYQLGIPTSSSRTFYHTLISEKNSSRFANIAITDQCDLVSYLSDTPTECVIWLMGFVSGGGRRKGILPGGA